MLTYIWPEIQVTYFDARWNPGFGHLVVTLLIRLILRIARVGRDITIQGNIVGQAWIFHWGVPITA